MCVPKNCDEWKIMILNIKKKKQNKSPIVRAKCVYAILRGC